MSKKGIACSLYTLILEFLVSFSLYFSLCALHLFDFSPVCVYNVSSNRQLEIMNSNINCICLVFLHCAFPNVYSKSLGQHRQSHTVCTFWCVLSDSPQNAVMWGCEITQGGSTASPSTTRRGNHLHLHLLQLHNHVTPVWRCTWAGFALCGPPPSPPR